MSKEHAKKFIEHVQRDETLRKKVNDAADHIVKVAKDHGYDVTRADISKSMKEHWSAQKGDEDDAQIIFSEAPGF